MDKGQPQAMAIRIPSFDSLLEHTAFQFCCETWSVIFESQRDLIVSAAQGNDDGARCWQMLQLVVEQVLFWGLSYQILDDLKDVLQSSVESGKTVSRDHTLNRPNLALMLGIEGASRRLERMIRIGDSLARRLISARPALRFLNELRAELGQEALRLTESACIAVGGGSA
jgi:hypothetical protein